MRKQHFLSSLSMLALVAISPSVNAQSVSNWGTSTIDTWTPGHVGIGTSSIPGDAWLHIYGQPTSITCFDGFGWVPSDFYPNTELIIDRQLHFGGGRCAPASSNLLQISQTLFSTTAPPSLNILDVFNADGWLGILQPNPSKPLDVNGDGLIENDLSVNHDLSVGNNSTVENNLFVKGGNIDMTTSASIGDVWRSINANSNSGGLNLISGIPGSSVSTGGSYVKLHAGGESVSNGGMDFAVLKGGASSSGYTFYSWDGVSWWNYLMQITPEGKVVIGEDIITPTLNAPDGYNLYVSKGILTEKLKVANHSDFNWSDFVFNKDYNLMPLNAVESFIIRPKWLQYRQC